VLSTPLSDKQMVAAERLSLDVLATRYSGLPGPVLNDVQAAVTAVKSASSSMSIGSAIVTILLALPWRPWTETHYSPVAR
jgi:hypothetical protein